LPRATGAAARLPSLHGPTHGDCTTPPARFRFTSCRTRVQRFCNGTPAGWRTVRRGGIGDDLAHTCRACATRGTSRCTITPFSVRTVVAATA